MGLFAWLLGRKVGAESAPRRELSPGLEEYVTRLLELDPDRKGIDFGEPEEKAKEIGREINDRYGFDGMVAVCDGFRARGGRARSLELIWHGIGEWQG